MKRPSSWSLLAASVSAWLPAWACRADTVNEAELNATAVNNTLATAQVIAPGAFTAPSSPNVFGALPTASVVGRSGGDDVDFYAFDVFTPTIAHFDIDATSGGFDSYLALFDATGTVIAANDDSFPADPGSASDLDAFIGVFSIATPGRYYLGVSTSPNAPLAAFSGTLFPELVRPDGAFGGNALPDSDFGVSQYLSSGPQLGAEYTLHVSVPAPGAGVVLVAGACVLTRRRR